MHILVESLTSLDALFWIKLIAFTISTILGLLGAFHDFKDQRNRLNRWGRMNVAGLVISAMIGVLAQVEESKQQEATSEAAKAAMQSLIDKNTQLLMRSDVLLKSTSESLTTQTKTLAATQMALSGVQRQLEAVNGAISVDYDLNVLLDNPIYRGAEDYLNQKLNELAGGAAKGEIDKEDTEIYKYNDKAGRLQYFALFGPKSVLQQPPGHVGAGLRNVPFVISFWKTKPPIEPASALSGDAAARFNWEGWGREYVQAVPHAAATGYLSPVTSYRSEDKSMSQGLSHAGFQAEGEDALLSALDFDRTYMRVVNITFGPVEFCSFSVTIGPKVIVVPTAEVEKDPDGGFIYRIPSGKNTSAVFLNRVKEETVKCTHP